MRYQIQHRLNDQSRYQDSDRECECGLGNGNHYGGAYRLTRPKRTRHDQQEDCGDVLKDKDRRGR